MSIESKIMDDFKTALKGIEHGENKWLVTSYDDESDFKWLWGLKGDGDADLDLVIIWDGMPEDKSGGINILDHLTPYDWALSFSYQQLREQQRENSVKLPKLRILIVDLYSHHQPNALAVKMLPAFCHAMPWMQVFRPLPMDDKYTLTLCELADWAKSPVNKQLSSYQSRNALNQLEPVVDAWVGNVSRGSDHHAIANLIAPRLLLDPSDLSEEQDPAKEALSRLVENLGLLPHQDRTGGEDNALLSDGNHWIDWEDGEWKQKLTRLGTGKKLKLLILDDQWKDGWGEVICKAVGAEFDPPKDDENKKEKKEKGFVHIGKKPDGLIQVKACGTAKWLVGDGKLISSKASDQRFKLRLDQNGEDCQEILFLDLRLFSKGTVDEEATFIEQLLQIAEKFLSSDFPKKLPWPGFDADELREIREWPKPENRGREKSGYHKALTLLPRIISLIDLSYPIILFSSTGRREIVESFKEYGNIITDFDKPRLTGALSDGVVSQFASNFVRGFDSATDMLLARIICKGLSAVPLGTFDRTGNDESNRHTYVELYVDESEDNANKFFVGGCYAVFTGKSALEARKKADAFDDALVESGIRYFNAFGIGPTPSRIKKKKQTVENELLNAMEADENKQYKPICLGWLRITSDPYRDSKIEGDILDPKSIDNLFRLSLSSLIEIFLFESVPEIMNDSSENGMEVSIFAGTRVKFLSGKDKKTNKKCHSDNFRFGIDSIKTRKGNYLQFSVSREAVYPIVSDALSSHDKGIRVHRAVGVQLPYTKEKPTEFPEIFLCGKCGEMTKIRARDDVEKGVLKSPLICTACDNSDNLRPDYRALHYLADEILSNFPSEDKSSLYDSVFSTYSAPGQFDDILNEDLQRLLLVSRALDRGDIASAIVDIVSVNVLQYDGAHTAYKLASRRASSLLNYLDGTDFMEVCTRLPAVMFEHPFYSIIVQEKTAYKGYKYFVGVLQEGPYKGKSVFIPDRFSKLRRLRPDERLKVRYSEKGGKLRAEKLRLT